MNTQAASMSTFDSWQESLRRTIPALDGVRGLAVLAVLAHQLCVDSFTSSHWITLLMTVPEAGWVGVQLFFVLSGFLITGILLETRGASNRWSSFFVRRALRIFPPYYFLLVLLFCVLPAFLLLPPDFRASLARQSWYWFYLSNWAVVGGAGVSALAHCWSLAVEEQFYLLWPPIVFAIRLRTLVWLCVLMAGAALFIRVWIVATGRNTEYAYELTVSRMDGLAIGALTAILARHRKALTWVLPRLQRWRWLVLVGLTAVTLASRGFARSNPITLTLGHTVLAIASAYLILLAVRDHSQGSGRTGQLLARAPLRLFGKHSYAIYLFHHPLHMVAERYYLARAVAPLGQWQYLGVQLAYFVLGSGILLGMAMLFHVTFERPILNLKRHFTARKQSDLTTRECCGRVG